MHPLDRFARAVESTKTKRNCKYCCPLQLSLVFLLVASCQTYAPMSWIDEPIWLEKMTPNNVSLINSDPETYKYKDNDEYLPPIDLRKKPCVLDNI